MEKRYDFRKHEEEIREFWEREQIYRFNPNGTGELYSIDTPPPTVSGSLHIGHLFSYTQAEMIARFRKMQGQNVFYPFGFDDNGLPTERLVERDAGIRGNSLPRSVFTEKCMETTVKYENEFKALWKSMGFSVDWSLQYETISPAVRKIAQALFLDLVKMGKAYVKESPVLWCCECGTSIAQAELDTAEVDSTFNYIPFAAGDAVLEVATTRPELLYGCVCLFVNPSDTRFAEYIGKTAAVPLYDYEIPILGDEKVETDKGTGVVMCATFGDSTDAQWFSEHALPYRRVILPNGTIAEEVPLIGGLSIISARKQIIRRLQENGLLLKQEPIRHTVATHERCGRAVEIIPSKQWYIDVLTDKDRFLKAADEINWYPAGMKSRYIAWVQNLKWDWCVSRQRFFGVPFPIWYCKNCAKPVLADIEDLPVNPLETEYKGTCTCGCSEFIPERAVLDTWATSSVTPQINEQLGLKLSPMSMRAHAHEIVRTWTFYTIVRSLYHTGVLPWKDLMISGFVLAKKGEKMSKSKNNGTFSPENLIQTHSADALRYWSANARLGTDTFFDTDALAVSKRFLTKLWNASRFAVSHLEDTDFSCKPALLPVDEWMIERTNQTILRAAKLLYEYEIGSARHEIDELFWKDFCDSYIEIVKDRLYSPKIHGSEARKSGQYALYYTLFNILKLYAVYVPFIAEHIYQEFFRAYEKSISIHQLQWEKPQSVNAEILAFGEELKAVLSEMRRYKSENNLSMKSEMDKLTIRTGFIAYFLKTMPDIRACANAKEVEIVPH